MPLQAVDLIQPDVIQVGGILELKKIAAMAEAHYVGFQPHNPYGPICTMASLHIDVCTPNFLIQEGGIHSWFQEATIGVTFQGKKTDISVFRKDLVWALAWMKNDLKTIPGINRHYPGGRQWG